MFTFTGKMLSLTAASLLATTAFSSAQNMDELVAANPNSFRAYLERFRFYRGTVPERAVGDLAEALRLAPDEADVRLAAADLAREQDRPSEARDHLERGLKRHPRDVRFHLALAAWEERAGSREKAAARLQRGLRELPSSGELRWPLADLLLESGDLEEARQVIADLRATATTANTSLQFGISFGTSGTQTLYFDGSGTASTLPTVNSRYRLDITWNSAPTGLRYAYLKVWWPAAATAENASGSTGMFAAFDRN